MIELPKKIFLVGQFCSGKGYVAEALRNEGYTEVAWSDGVYDEAATMTGLSVDFIRANKAEYRQLLQAIGTERRRQDPEYWIKALLKKIEGIDRVVEAGTRFENEIEAAHRIGGYVIRVKTARLIRLSRYKRLYDRYPAPEEELHESERLVPYLPVDAEIDGTYGGDIITYLKATLN